MPFSTTALAAVPAEQILTSDQIVTTLPHFHGGGWVQMDVSPEMLRAVKGGECRVWLIAVPAKAYERASGAFVSVLQARTKGAGV